MDEIRRLLQDGDPLKREPRMSADAADQVRRVLLRERAPQRRGASRLVLALSGALALVIGVGIWTVRLPSTGVTIPTARPSDAEAAMQASTSQGRRQVQFATPGGTRVIWQLDTTSH